MVLIISNVRFNNSYQIQNFIRMAKGFDKKCCDQFQNDLNYDRVDTIWKSFREAGNSIEGRIIKLNFKKVLNKFGYKNQKFLDKLFDRFKLDKFYELKTQKEQIDLQDFVIGLATLSRMNFLDKVKFIFYLTDLDQDGCLSLEEIENMIERVQKIFCKQNSSAKVESYSLLFDLAHKKAQRNYRQMLVLLKRNNKQLKNDEGGLITCDEFIEALKYSKDLYLQEKFIPLNLSLFEIIENTAGQPLIRISENNKAIFCQFRKEIYSILQNNKADKDSNNLIKYPGKVDIIRNDKVIETLPTFEKTLDKKKDKPQMKVKQTAAFKGNVSSEFKELTEQKTAQQNLQTYKLKVKKMIQTKEDPRLNIHFDHILRKGY